MLKLIIFTLSILCLKSAHSADECAEKIFKAIHKGDLEFAGPYLSGLESNNNECDFDEDDYDLKYWDVRKVVLNLYSDFLTCENKLFELNNKMNSLTKRASIADSIIRQCSWDLQADTKKVASRIEKLAEEEVEVEISLEKIYKRWEQPARDFAEVYAEMERKRREEYDKMLKARTKLYKKQLGIK